MWLARRAAVKENPGSNHRLAITDFDIWPVFALDAKALK
jgi:hypothetical protein